MVAEYISELITQKGQKGQEALKHYVLGFSRAQRHGLVHVEQTLLQSQWFNFSLGVRTGHFTNDQNTHESLNQRHCQRFRYARNVTCWCRQY